MSQYKKFTINIDVIVQRWAVGYTCMRLNAQRLAANAALTATYEACPYSRIYDFANYEAYIDGARCAAEEMGLRLPFLRIRPATLPRYV